VYNYGHTNKAKHKEATRNQHLVPRYKSVVSSVFLSSLPLRTTGKLHFIVCSSLHQLHQPEVHVKASGEASSFFKSAMDDDKNKILFIHLFILNKANQEDQVVTCFVHEKLNNKNIFFFKIK